MILEQHQYLDPALVMMRTQEHQSKHMTEVIDPFGNKRFKQQKRVKPMDFRLRTSRDLQDRLTIWGQVVRDTRKPSESMTATICRQLKAHAGKLKYAPQLMLTQDQVSDAWFLEQVACQLPRNERTALIMYYVLNAHPRVICRFTAIHYFKFDDLMYNALTMFKNILDRRQKMSHNTKTI